MEEQEINTILGHSDLEIIKKVKESVSIPVIGNGDVKTAKDAKRMFEYTGVDGIMIGRAALGQPWIIGQLVNELNNENISDITNKKKLEIIKNYIILLKK